LTRGSQYTLETGFAGNVGAFVGKHGNYASRWHLSKARLIGNGQDYFAFFICECVCRARMHSRRSLVPLHETVTRFPPLQGPQIDASKVTGRFEPSAVGMGLLNVLSNFLAIFQPDQSSGPSP
jgi:hypothetical protein